MGLKIYYNDENEEQQKLISDLVYLRYEMKCILWDYKEQFNKVMSIREWDEVMSFIKSQYTPEYLSNLNDLLMLFMGKCNDDIIEFLYWYNRNSITLLSSYAKRHIENEV